uniref:PRAME nuclear receptor transcriptional regulator n=1 Tax=Suricata suricatta TaxID=37032 RepID=A0A673UIY3_SURSU
MGLKPTNQLAGKSLLRNEGLAIAALETLPAELFPPLFMEAYDSRCNETLKAVVQAWPFARLPLGGLARIPNQKVLKAVLGGLDLLLAQKVRPRRWKLRVLHLRNASQNFWGMWSAATAQECLRVRPVAEHCCRMEEPSRALTVCIDLCLRKKTLDEVFTYLLMWAARRRRSKVLNKVQLGCILELEVKDTKMKSTLSMFAPYLGQMTHPQTLVHPFIKVPVCEEEKQHVAQFTSQLLKMHHLRKLHIPPSIFLEDCLDETLRCLKAPLETLSITYSQLTEWDLVCLSQCPSITQLKELGLRGVRLTSVHMKPLQVLLETVAATLQTLNLEHCDLLDTHLEAILPALSHCYQLRSLNISWNFLSMAVVQQLLHHNPKMDHLSLVVYPYPLDIYPFRGLNYDHRLKIVREGSVQAQGVWLFIWPCYI